MTGLRMTPVMQWFPICSLHKFLMNDSGKGINLMEQIFYSYARATGHCENVLWPSMTVQSPFHQSKTSAEQNKELACKCNEKHIFNCCEDWCLSQKFAIPVPLFRVSLEKLMKTKMVTTPSIRSRGMAWLANHRVCMFDVFSFECSG